MAIDIPGGSKRMDILFLSLTATFVAAIAAMAIGCAALRRVKS